MIGANGIAQFYLPYSLPLGLHDGTNGNAQFYLPYSLPLWLHDWWLEPACPCWGLNMADPPECQDPLPAPEEIYSIRTLYSTNS